MVKKAHSYTHSHEKNDVDTWTNFKNVFFSLTTSSQPDEASLSLLDEAFDFIKESTDAENWNGVTYLLDGLILLINTDT